jgi:hypothetical protein
VAINQNQLDIMQPNSDPVYLASQGLSPTTVERFLSKISVDEKTGCWNWTGFIHNGYGYLSRGIKRGHSVKASIVSYILYYGPVPEGFHVLHKCPRGHNKRCANPEHIKSGTRSENMQDWIKEKGGHHFSKNPPPTGSQNPNSCLTQEQRDSIISAYTGKRGQQSQLARQFSVSQATIWNVVNHVVSGQKH